MSKERKAAWPYGTNLMKKWSWAPAGSGTLKFTIDPRGLAALAFLGAGGSLFWCAAEGLLVGTAERGGSGSTLIG